MSDAFKIARFWSKQPVVARQTIRSDAGIMAREFLRWQPVIEAAKALSACVHDAQPTQGRFSLTADGIECLWRVHETVRAASEPAS